jgi:hypothetical protein
MQWSILRPGGGHMQGRPLGGTEEMLAFQHKNNNLEAL